MNEKTNSIHVVDGTFITENGKMTVTNATLTLGPKSNSIHVVDGEFETDNGKMTITNATLTLLNDEGEDNMKTLILKEQDMRKLVDSLPGLFAGGNPYTSNSNSTLHNALGFNWTTDQNDPDGIHVEYEQVDSVHKILKLSAEMSVAKDVEEANQAPWFPQSVLIKDGDYIDTIDRMHTFNRNIKYNSVNSLENKRIIELTSELNRLLDEAMSKHMAYSVNGKKHLYGSKLEIELLPLKAHLLLSRDDGWGE